MEYDCKGAGALTEASAVSAFVVVVANACRHWRQANGWKRAIICLENQSRLSLGGCGGWGMLVAIMLVTYCDAAEDGGRDWVSYLGDEGRTHYSTLSAINAKNVHQLQPAWVFNTGDLAPDSRASMECNPLVVGGVLYGTTPLLKLFALDAGSGKELWRFDPATSGAIPDSQYGSERSRGITYWTDGVDKRILFTSHHFLYAIDATSGKLIPSFGKSGWVNLKEGFNRDLKNVPLGSATPGAIFENLLILPIRTADGPVPAAPGDIRAFDVRTGRVVWTFHTVPHPGEFGYESWPGDAWTVQGAVNCWAGMAVDPELGLVFAPTGSANYDFWGGNRQGDNLFANTLLCLDARTGERRWHFQIVRHDIWDRDLPAPPTLLTVSRGGKRILAVAQVTKSGLVFVFDRKTGESLFPLGEMEAPASEIPGEKAALSQPWPLRPAPFARQSLTYADLTELTPEAHRAALARFSRLKPYHPFQPPSRQGTIVFPGFDGGAEWGGAAADPGGILYINASDTPWIVTMAESGSGSVRQGTALGRATFTQMCASCHQLDRSGNPNQNIPALIGLSARRKPHEVLELITSGKGTMPSFAFLAEGTRKALVSFLLSPDQAAIQPGRQSSVEALDAQHGGVPPEMTSHAAPFVSTGYERWLDSNGYPAVKPPWGTLNAIDLNTGDYLWRVPLGELPELTARGVPPTGTDNYGGPVVTAGEVLFIAATRDKKIRAFNSKDGSVLWEARLPASGFATPATYLVRGKQYLVIACGGGRFGEASSDAYVAFALPEPRG